MTKAMNSFKRQFNRWPLVFLLSTGTLCFAASTADKVNLESEFTSKNVRTEESNLANVVTDAIRDLEKSDAALMHASAFVETAIPKGDTDIETIIKAVQYREDTVVIVNLTGDQIQKALENGLKLIPQRSPEFLQVSGLSFTADPTADREKRVSDLKIGKARVESAKTYKVAMPSPLANGALGYYRIWDKTKDLDHDTGKSVGQVVDSFLKTKKALSGKLEDRIVIKK